MPQTTVQKKHGWSETIHWAVSRVSARENEQARVGGTTEEGAGPVPSHAPEQHQTQPMPRPENAPWASPAQEQEAARTMRGPEKRAVAPQRPPVRPRDHVARRRRPNADVPARCAHHQTARYAYQSTRARGRLPSEGNGNAWPVSVSAKKQKIVSEERNPRPDPREPGDGLHHRFIRLSPCSGACVDRAS